MNILCLGDSLTFGYDVPMSQRWTNIVERETGFVLQNEGVCGDTTAGMVVRLENLDLKGRDAFFIMGGINDIMMDRSYEDVKKNMETIWHMAEAGGTYPIIVGISPLATPESVFYGWQAAGAVDRHNDLLTAYRDWLLGQCQQRGYATLDLYTIMKKLGPAAYADGAHPNAIGYAEIAKEAVKLFKKVLIQNRS